MHPVAPAAFYTGLVAELYEPLRSEVPDPEPYARFVAAVGEPALELGCGSGDPLLALRARGLQVEGLDASADMLDRCRRAAADRGLDVVLHHQTVEAMDLHKRFCAIYLAGPTFTLLVDDEAAGAALRRIATHLEPDGVALVPLFVPAPLGAAEIGRPSEARRDDGALLRVTPVAQRRDEHRRRQVTTLRYELIDGDRHEVEERDWVLHWHTRDGFGRLAAAAGLRTAAIVAADGSPAGPDADVLSFRLVRDA
jgi:SAM-dependent methyltransferase